MKVFTELNLIPNASQAGQLKAPVESEWHHSVRSGFLFVSPASERSSSDDLIIELFREVFFEKRSEGEGKLTRIKKEHLVHSDDSLQTIDNLIFTPSEKYSLHMAKGRQKQTSKVDEISSFYTPLYPSLARTTWRSKNNERCISSFFFRAIAQHLSEHADDGRHTLEKHFIDMVFSALSGTSVNENGGRDIAGLDISPMAGCISEKLAKQKIANLIGHHGKDAKEEKFKSIFKLKNKSHDLIAKTVFEDFLALCALEKKIDRLQWINLLKTYLRFTSSVWLLSQMKITVTLRDKLLNILNGEPILDIDETWVENLTQDRAKGLFIPSLTTLTRQVETYIQGYVKARSELNILVAVVEKYSKKDWSKRSISLYGGSKQDLSILELITETSKCQPLVKEDLGDTSLRNALTRHCEQFTSWTQPVTAKAGPAKKYNEFVLVLRKLHIGDEEGGHLIVPSLQKNAGYHIFPGHLLLKLMTYLTRSRKKDGPLILSDVEASFKCYGLDFGAKGDIRPKLIETLQEIGLLKGSPDAGDSVAVKNPYT